MKLKELKKALEKFGKDDENSEVVILTLDQDCKDYEYDCLAFTCFFPHINNCIGLGSQEVAYKMISEGKLNKDDFGPQDNIDELFPPEE